MCCGALEIIAFRSSNMYMQIATGVSDCSKPENYKKKPFDYFSGVFFGT